MRNQRSPCVVSSHFLCSSLPPPPRPSLSPPPRGSASSHLLLVTSHPEEDEEVFSSINSTKRPAIFERFPYFYPAHRRGPDSPCVAEGCPGARPCRGHRRALSPEEVLNADRCNRLISLDASDESVLSSGRGRIRVGGLLDRNRAMR